MQISDSNVCKSTIPKKGEFGITHISGSKIVKMQAAMVAYIVFMIGST
jgi:hypothetical protein